MAEHTNSQETENNSWVITGPEAAPVEDLGCEASEETQLEASPPETELFVDSPDLEEEKSESPEAEDNLISRDSSSQESSTLLLLDEKKTDSPRAEEEFFPLSQSTPTGPPEDEPKASSVGEEAASPEADVEGLRRRKGRVEIQQVGPELPHDRVMGVPEDEDDGLSRMKWLLAVLAVVGFGILATLGVFLEAEDGGLDMLNLGLSSDGEGPHPANSGQDWSPSLDSANDAQLRVGKEALSEDPKSLDAMGILLDKLAKENQDIRLMQAELQAQKEELEILLQKSEVKTLAVDSVQQNLAAENTRLAEALKRETAALSAARSDIHLLREKVRRPEPSGDAKSRRHPGEDTVSHHPPGKLERQEKELHRLRSLLASFRQDLGRLVEKTPLEELKDLEQRLGKELDLSEAEKEPQVPWKARQGKAKSWQKKYQGEEKFRHQDRDPKVASEKEPHHPKRHQTKPPRSGDHQRGPRKARKPMEPQELWERLAKHPYSTPQGCSGVAECAQREGLAPVQKNAFLKLVQNYLAGLGWGQYAGELVPVLEGHFGSEGVFAHERVSFVDFLDKIEDALEELARSLGVSEDGVDDFEDVILKQLGAAPGRRSTHGHGAKERSPHKTRAYG
ncbi:pre-B-cell leukemia transcription factor-interacting protein 1 [Protobothrops mucrosquamatus]|uniref:pre-B-cell leukemia transcription factor-interacting protein 1 n=1 Tax=Protobothrops mucrosquamatus TaxID=103944 RepID=UPI000775DB92|nr:pre-B-cell leukemia transcription factor-interacting protein 1 [Protobothrops mucrosquamatus]